MLYVRNNSVSENSFVWKIGGWLAIITPFMIAVFYQVLTVWLLAYFIGAVTGNLDVMAQQDYFDNFIQDGSVFIYLAVLTLLIGFILVMSFIFRSNPTNRYLILDSFLAVLFITIPIILLYKQKKDKMLYILISTFSLI